MDVATYWTDIDVFAAGQSAVATHSPDEKLTAYLEEFQNDKLSTGTAEEVPSYALQRKVFIDAMSKTYSKAQSYHLTISGLDIGIAKYWELIFSMDFVSHEIKLMNIGSDYIEPSPGLRSTRKVPYAEFTVIDENLKKSLAPENEHTSPAPKVITSTPPAEHALVTIRSYDAASGTLFIGDHQVQIVRQKNRQGKAVGETTQGGAMRKLFKDVNTLRNGVELNSIISVRKDNFDVKKRKRATNHLDEINRKVEEETSISKLIVYDKVKYYIAKPYLK